MKKNFIFHFFLTTGWLISLFFLSHAKTLEAEMASPNIESRPTPDQINWHNQIVNEELNRISNGDVSPVSPPTVQQFKRGDSILQEKPKPVFKKEETSEATTEEQKKIENDPIPTGEEEAQMEIKPEIQIKKSRRLSQRRFIGSAQDLEILNAVQESLESSTTRHYEFPAKDSGTR